MLVWIYAAGLAQAVLVIAALASIRVRNSQARWLLVGLLTIFSALLLEEFLDLAGLGAGLGGGLVLEFALGPLLYLFVRTVGEDEPQLTRRDALHFAALIPAAVVWAILYFGYSARHISLSRPDMREIVAAIVFIKIVWFSAYAIAVLRNQPEASRRQALRGMKPLLWVWLGAYALSALSFVGFYFRLSWMPDSDGLGAVIMALSIFGLGYFALVRRDVFEHRRPYSGSSMTPEEAASLRRRAEAYLTATEVWRNPDYSLRALADALGLGEARLSQALNAADAGGFHALLNLHRLAAFKAAAADPARRDESVLDLALDAGFNSKATFYRAFAADEALTPSRYRAVRLKQAEAPA